MQRRRNKDLEKWLLSSERKPLILRGARQVGKTWLVRHFAKGIGKKLIEINFEKHPGFYSLFASNDPKEVLLNISSVFNIPIDVNESLLFLDEIQAVPDLIAKLRWFAEELSQLPVIAAGSLLDFVLDNHSFSMPVGRINYMHLEPLSFEEFLMAGEHIHLLKFLEEYSFAQTVPSAIHALLLKQFKEYLIIGGMPAAVLSWMQERSLQQVNQIHHDLMTTYRDDIAKYKGRMVIERVEDVLMAIPKYLAEKFVYAKINPDLQSSTIKLALELLCKARVGHKILGVAANGIPLGAEVLQRYIKVIFLDVGLVSALLGLSLDQLTSMEEITLINRGGIAEQVVGQMLRTLFPYYIEPALYCWHREEKGSTAELDYIIQQGQRIIPIEVKAGTTGTLKSLHLFMHLKKLPFAIRINSDVPSKMAIEFKDSSQNKTQYILLSLPFYFLEQIPRLIRYLA